MLPEGHLFYFMPFYFKNGNIPDNKFFIVLKNLDNVSVIASLPTSVNNAPSLIDKKHGCINIEDRMFNCYAFEENRAICENGFCFELPTFVYGNQIEDYQISILTKGNTIKENEDYKLAGILNEAEFKSLKECLSNSNSIKRRFKKILAD